MINVFENRKTRRSGTKNEEQQCNPLYQIRVICSLLSFIITLLQKKMKNSEIFVWKLDKRDKRGVCYGEIVACVSDVEERKKGVGMGREGKGFLFLILLQRNCPNPPLPFCARHSGRSSLQVCHMKRSVEHFLKLFLCSILIRDC